MKRILVAVAGVAVVVFVTAAASAMRAAPSAAPAAAVTPAADVVIKHASFGCHVLSVSGERGAATQEVTLQEGSLLTVANVDSCRHTLTQASGPESVWMGDPATGKSSDGSLPYGTTVALRFTTLGTYEFGTIEGPHGYTIQEKAGDAASAPDNDLLLRVTVIPLMLGGGLPTPGHATIG